MISSGEQLAFFGFGLFEHPNTQFKNTISKSRILKVTTTVQRELRSLCNLGKLRPPYSRSVVLELI